MALKMPIAARLLSITVRLRLISPKKEMMTSPVNVPKAEAVVKVPMAAAFRCKTSLTKGTIIVQMAIELMLLMETNPIMANIAGNCL
ncbi:hypothetical protein D3C76_1447640 [compost metagenome]